jgi:general secretion pathway protein E
VDTQRYVGEILVRRGAIPADRLEDLLRTASERDASILDVLSANRETDGGTIARALADEVGIPFVEKIKNDDIPANLVERIPISFARQHRLLGLSEDGERGPIRVAIANPLDPAPLDDLRALLGRECLPVAASPETIEDAINRVYERKDESALGEAKAGEEVEELQDLLDMTDEAPVIRWVNNLFYTASQQRASDIHIEPSEKEVVVRYRIDGNLVPAKTAHKGFLKSIVSRVKIEANLNIAETRLPQDGRITKKIQGRMIDVRVSTIPQVKGERIVMRLLDKEKVLLDLTDLGYHGAQLDTIQHLITRPNGIILVTGPTGSGKTTTLYACLSRINTPDLNILTAEDPVEYEIKGIGQMHVQAKIGLTFAAALRAFLRQDPDVIMVGEIRDHETAEIAIHASLTGHMVLSTIHTNDAAGAITRLGEMGVEHYLITSSLLAVIAQRLVRRLCPKCRQPYEPTDSDFRQLGVDRSQLAALLGSSGVQSVRGMGEEDGGVVDLSSELEPDDLQAEPTVMRAVGEAPAKASALRPVFYRPMGCEECTAGYRGRVAIAEILIIDDPVRREILNKSDAGQVTRVAQSRGMRTLREDGARMVLQGTTSLDEVLAATQAGEVEG